jgi:hypothetical protein
MTTNEKLAEVTVILHRIEMELARVYRMLCEITAEAAINKDPE